MLRAFAPFTTVLAAMLLSGCASTPVSTPPSPTVSSPAATSESEAPTLTVIDEGWEETTEDEWNAYLAHAFPNRNLYPKHRGTWKIDYKQIKTNADVPDYYANLSLSPDQTVSGVVADGYDGPAAATRTVVCAPGKKSCRITEKTGPDNPTFAANTMAVTPWADVKGWANDLVFSPVPSDSMLVTYAVRPGTAAIQRVVVTGDGTETHTTVNVMGNGWAATREVLLPIGDTPEVLESVTLTATATGR